MSLAKLKRSLDDKAKRLRNYCGIPITSGVVGSHMVGDREYESATPLAFRTNFDRFPEKMHIKMRYSALPQRGWVDLDEVYGYYDDVCEYRGAPQLLYFDEDRKL